MAGIKVSEYFSEFSVKLDRASFKRADTEIEKLVAKLKKTGNDSFGFRIGKFNVDQAALRLALGNALDLASKSVPFEISKFVVNDRNLQAALLRAARRLPPLPPGGGPGGGPHPPYPPHPGPYPPYPPRPGPYPPDSRVRRGMMGGIGGGLSNFYAPALALGLGGYGLSELNKRNQQVVSAQLQSQSVVEQAGGTATQGKQSFEYLRKEANRIGFNYLDASGDYNKLISGLTGSGVGLGESQKVFSGFAELARVNKLDKTTQNRLFRALSQVAGKGKLQAEELTGQISEALPSGTALFARAYQAQLAATGKGKGDLTGQAAIQALLAAMKKGQVTSEILTYAGQDASNQARQGGALDRAQTASQAEQQRYQNAVSDLAVVASNAGVEEGFARIFRTLNAGLEESNGLVESLAEGFNEATKWADDLLLWPQSFVRALQGRDSVVADWLGKEETAQLISDWQQIKAMWQDINSISAPSWLPTLEATSKELKSLLEAIAKLQGVKDQSKGIIQEEYAKDPSVWGNIKGVAKANWFTFTNTVDALNPVDMDQAGSNWKGWLGMSPAGATPQSMQWDDAASQNAFAADAARAAAYDAQEQGIRTQLMGALQSPSAVFPGSSSDASRQSAMEGMNTPVVNNANQFDISINVDAATLAGMDVQVQAEAMASAFTAQLTTAFEQVQVNYPMKQ